MIRQAAQFSPGTSPNALSLDGVPLSIQSGAFGAPLADGHCLVKFD
jgi:hypothetical protein